MFRDALFHAWPTPEHPRSRSLTTYVHLVCKAKMLVIFRTHPLCYCIQSRRRQPQVRHRFRGGILVYVVVGGRRVTATGILTMGFIITGIPLGTWFGLQIQFWHSVIWKLNQVMPRTRVSAKIIHVQLILLLLGLGANWTWCGMDLVPPQVYLFQGWICLSRWKYSDLDILVYPPYRLIWESSPLTRPYMTMAVARTLNISHHHHFYVYWVDNANAARYDTFKSMHISLRKCMVCLHSVGQSGHQLRFGLI